MRVGRENQVETILAQLNEQLALLFLLTIKPEESRESSLLIVHTINRYEMI